MKQILIFAIALFTASSSFAQHMESVYETVQNISLGWNCGCVFDGGESQRYSTPGFMMNFEEGIDFSPVKEELFQYAASQGIDAVRLMIQWGEFSDPRTKEARKYMFDRIQEVVDYIINSGMYCILSFNSDWFSNDSRYNWFCADYSNYAEISIMYKKVWKQIADRFKDYGPLLIFDSINEIVDGERRWENAPKESLLATNLLTQDFVDIVRSTGGNNTYRNLLVSLYTGQSDCEEYFEAFKFPTDVSDEKHIFFSHHIYYIDSDAKALTDYSVAKINSVLHLLDKYFISKGIPVIMGESGMCPLTVQDVSETNRSDYYEYLLSEASKLGISALAWDDVVDGIDRNYCRLSSPKCFETMKRNSPLKGRPVWNSSGKSN